MAVIDLNLLANESATINSSNANDGDIVELNLLGNNNVTVDGVAVEIDVTVGLNAVGGSTISAVNGADVVIGGVAGVSALNSVTYNIGADSSLTYGGEFLDVSLLESTEINFLGNEGTGTFKFIAPSVNLNLSTFPVITGLSNGDSIIVERLNLVGQTQAATAATYNASTGVLTVTGPSLVGIGTVPYASFNIEGDIPEDATFTIGPNGTVTYACYLRGTLIATPEGQKRVEDLQAGDKVLTASGGVATVKWLGQRKLHASRIYANDAVRAFPVRIAAGALAPNVPARDLFVSPGHHMFFDGKLVPAMLLVNGKTITQDFTMQSFEYFHVELDHFDILLAEGAPAESYVDTGNRSMFQNADSVAMNPDFGPAEGRPEVAGIEVVRSGPAVEAIRKRLLKRAEALTQSVRVSDPDLRVEVNGQEVRAETAGQIEGVMRFVLPAGADASDVRILSRSAVVRDVTAHARRDLRQVGVGLARITIEDAAGRRDIDLCNEQLSGLHAVQDVHGVTMRWTNGAATIPAALLNATGQAVLELHVLRTYSYWEQAKRAA